MDFDAFIVTAAAVVLGNAVSFAFFMAAMQASKSQKQGRADDELPLWVYPCLVAAPVAVAVGLFLV